MPLTRGSRHTNLRGRSGQAPECGYHRLARHFVNWAASQARTTSSKTSDHVPMFRDFDSRGTGRNWCIRAGVDPASWDSPRNGFPGAPSVYVEAPARAPVERTFASGARFDDSRLNREPVDLPRNINISGFRLSTAGPDLNDHLGNSNNLSCDRSRVRRGLNPMGCRRSPHWTERLPARCLKP